MKGYVILVLTCLIGSISSNVLTNDEVCIGKNNGHFVDYDLNCQSYWVCHNEIGYFGECDPEYTFNEIDQICDAHLHCENPTPPTESEPTPPTSAPDPEEPTPIRCPSTGIHFFGIDNICSKYHFCFGGHHSIRECSPGLQFDIVQGKCDRPEIANCEYRHCPSVDNLSTLVTFPGSNSCQEYSICYNGRPESFQCANDIQWNQATQECDLPENSNCGSADESLSCPDGNLQFIPHPSNCQQYYVCSAQAPNLRTCPDDLLFDPKISECNLAERVQC